MILVAATAPKEVAAVNAAFLLMSSAALAGADPAPAAAPAAPAPVVISSGGGCSNCGVPASDCCSKPGLLDRIKARFGKKSCDCAPPPCPAPCPPAPCKPACDPCAKSVADRPNLFDKLKARCGMKKSSGPCCDPCGAPHVSGCADPLPADAAPVTPGTGAPPKEMPKPKDEKPKGGNSATIPVPVPVPPTVNGAGLTAPSSPY